MRVNEIAFLIIRSIYLLIDSMIYNFMGVFIK